MKDLPKKILEKFKRREYQILLVILVVALILRLNYAFISGMWVDEGGYASIATQLLRNPLNYVEPFGGATVRPPVFPYMLFISMLIFGYGKFAAYLVNPIIGALSVAFVFFIGKKLYNKNVGIIASILFALNPIYWFLNERILTETPLMFMFLLSTLLFLYAFEGDGKLSKYALWLLIPSIFLTILTKPSGYLLFGIFFVYLVFTKKAEFLKEKGLWISLGIGAAGLGALSLVPGMFNTIKSSFMKAIRVVFVRGSVAGWASAQGPFYYLYLPILITLPLTIVFVLKVLKNIIISSDKDQNKALYVSLVMVPAIAASLFLYQKLVPLLLFFTMFLISSRKSEKFLWIWLAFGIGAPSFNVIKVPRYVVFAIPPLILLGSEFINSVSRKIGGLVEGNEKKVTLLVLIILVVPLVFFSYNKGANNIENRATGFQKLEPAGKFFRGKPDNTTIMTSSTNQIMFYSNLKRTLHYPDNESKLEEKILNESVDYLVLDAYERTQPDYVLKKVPKKSYVKRVKTFLQGKRPVVGIYKVNHEVLRGNIGNE